MAELTSKQLATQIEKKLLHNFGISAENASDDLFYKATVLVLLDITKLPSRRL